MTTYHEINLTENFNGEAFLTWRFPDYGVLQTLRNESTEIIEQWLIAENTYVRNINAYII